jgi:hypothetical protein
MEAVATITRVMEVYLEATEGMTFNMFQAKEPIDLPT